MNVNNSTIINGIKLEDKLEQLSELEHEQWMQWAMTLLDRMIQYELEDKTLKDLIFDTNKRWSPNIKPYSELTEEVKEYDRVWARKVLEVIKE